VFHRAGYEVDFVSVRGAGPTDGVKPDDQVVAAFLADQHERLTATPTPAEVDPGRLCRDLRRRGDGTMWDLPDDKDLAGLAAQIYQAGGVVAGVCHGPAGLVNVCLDGGSHLVGGSS